MATLLRSAVRQQGRCLRLLTKTRSSPAASVPFFKQCLQISTSKKNKDVVTPVEPMEKSTELKRLTKHFEDTDPNNEENWTSYGYENTDRDKDWVYHHVLSFCVISIGFCWGGFIIAYMPDYKFFDWCQREAFLELERREREGLPLVDPEYANVDQIELPSEEEIGDMEIVI